MVSTWKGSFDDKQSLASQEGSDFGGFHFDHSSGGSWDNFANHDSDDDESSHSSSTEDGNEPALLSRSPGDSAATPMASNKRRLSMDLSSDSDTPAANAETHVPASAYNRQCSAHFVHTNASLQPKDVGGLSLQCRFPQRLCRRGPSRYSACPFSLSSDCRRSKACSRARLDSSRLEAIELFH